MTKTTKCEACGGWTAWDDCGGFNADDMPICETCMDAYCDQDACDNECEHENKQCPNGRWRRFY